MALFTDICEIPYAQERAVIINVHTLLCTTLAILSVKRYMNMPLLVVDCPFNGMNDQKALERLQEDYGFDLLVLPLKSHGSTLDDIFTYISADWIYLVDSDVEIKSTKGLEQIHWMREHSMVPTDKLLGCGMRQLAGFGVPPQERWYYAERMWIPFCALHVSVCREAIIHGVSFNITSKDNYGKFGGGLRVLRNKMNRHGLQHLAKFVDWMKDYCRNIIRKKRIDLIYYDTGGYLYEWLREHGYAYLDITYYVYKGIVEHFCGVTRQNMYEGEPFATNIIDITETIKSRLYGEYNFDYERYYGVIQTT